MSFPTEPQIELKIPHDHVHPSHAPEQSPLAPRQLTIYSPQTLALNTDKTGKK